MNWNWTSRTFSSTLKKKQLYTEKLAKSGLIDTVFPVYNILQWKDQNYIVKEIAFYNTGSPQQRRWQNAQCTNDMNLTHLFSEKIQILEKKKYKNRHLWHSKWQCKEATICCTKRSNLQQEGELWKSSLEEGFFDNWVIFNGGHLLTQKRQKKLLPSRDTVWLAHRLDNCAWCRPAKKWYYLSQHICRL